MLKRLLMGAGAAGAMTAVYLLGSLTLGGALAQTAPTASPSTVPAAPAARAAKETGKQADTANEANEAAESAALASQAKITVDQAKAAALAQFPGATIGKTDLDSENGVVAYSVELTDSAGKQQDVSVDATSGTVLQAQAEGTETHGGAEGPETAD